MAYQSLKRVLSETSLERKCRLLFGACLLLLISSAFLWVDQVAENLVYRTLDQDRQATRERSRDFMALTLINEHFRAFTEARGNDDENESEAHRRLVEDLIRAFALKQTYRAEILAFDENVEKEIRLPVTKTETAALEYLLDQARVSATQAEQASAEKQQPETEPETPVTAPPFEKLLDQQYFHAEDATNLYYETVVTDERTNRTEYLYFQPVYHRDDCKSCHATLQGVGALPAAIDSPRVSRHYEPFRVVMIAQPFKQSRAEVHQIRAILSFAGIITFFVAMVALYVIVRYVIVSPLKHLRDVSDSISKGNTDLRADIHTNDEFEELAASFNRMLRHLTDTQGNLETVNRALDAKVDELAQLNMRLYEMNRLKSDFLANMSHELRTPLNSIIGFSEVLQSIESLTDKQKRYAQNIQKSGRVLLDMINDILDLAKIDAGKMEVRPTEFRVENAIHSQCDMVRALTESKNIDMLVDLAPGLPPMYQDQGKLQQILTNLLSNAIKFTPEGGRIAVRAERDVEGRLILTVADTGVGIAEEDREIIFEKFRQSHALEGEDGLTREYSGTGLGLSIVKELCKLMRGEIDFESELGKGSTFRVVLPWTYDDLPAGETTLASESQLRAQRVVSRG